MHFKLQKQLQIRVVGLETELVEIVETQLFFTPDSLSIHINKTYKNNSFLITPTLFHSNSFVDCDLNSHSIWKKDRAIRIS